MDGCQESVTNNPVPSKAPPIFQKYHSMSKNLNNAQVLRLSGQLPIFEFAHSLSRECTLTLLYLHKPALPSLLCVCLEFLLQWDREPPGSGFGASDWVLTLLSLSFWREPEIIFLCVSEKVFQFNVPTCQLLIPTDFRLVSSSLLGKLNFKIWVCLSFSEVLFLTLERSWNSVFHF